MISEQCLLASSTSDDGVDDSATTYNSMELSEKHDKDVEVETADRTNMRHTISNMQALVHLVKSMVGTGLLSMPNAFLHSGLWLGTGLTLLLALICLHCMTMLVRSSQVLCARKNKYCLDYGEMAKLSFASGPRSFRCFSNCSMYIVNLFVCIMQFGSCSVYIVFVADNIKRIVDQYEPTSPDVRLYMLAAGAILIPLCFIKHLTVIAYFSFIANLFVIVGLVILVQYLVRDLPDVRTRPAVNSVGYLPLYLGTALFAFEGIGVVMPLENKMAKPEDLGGFCGVLTLGLTISASLNTAIGFFGYLKIGDAVKGSITLNLPSGVWIYSVAQIMFACGILLTYLIQFYVPISLIWPLIEQRIHSVKRKYWCEYIFRMSIVLFSLLLAVVVPHIDLLISLFGALSATSLTIIFPMFIDTLVRYSDKSLTGLIMSKNILIGIAGFAGASMGVIVSINEIVNRYMMPDV